MTEPLSITRLTDEQLPAAAALIARLNADPTQNICYLDEQPDAVLTYLGKLAQPPSETFHLAWRAGQLVGVCGVEYDLEVGAAWLQGPLCADPEWDAVCEALYQAAVACVPAAIGEYEIGLDPRNQRAAALAARHGYTPGEENLVLLCPRANWAGPPAATLPELPESHAAALIALHEQCFPNTYYTGQQLLEMRADGHKLFACPGADGALHGYLFAGLAPTPGEVYIDFIGVAPEQRGHGIGRQLLDSLLAWAFELPATTQVALTVRSSNAAARALYRRAGFVEEKRLLGYRLRRPTPTGQ